MLISKISTYLSVKMHPKKVLAQKQIFRDYFFRKTVSCLKLFLGAFCHKGK
jgi:predicted restriction endonuclease